MQFLSSCMNKTKNIKPQGLQLIAEGWLGERVCSAWFFFFSLFVLRQFVTIKEKERLVASTPINETLCGLLCHANYDNKALIRIDLWDFWEDYHCDHMHAFGVCTMYPTFCNDTVTSLETLLMVIIFETEIYLWEPNFETNTQSGV